MAMLLLNPIFERTWGSRVGPRPATEYWTDLISAVKKEFKDFLFIAEAYWDMEWELQQQGFDFCYDKKLYDRLEHSNAENIRLHLCADLAYQQKLLRFIENHDEPRAAATFPLEKEQVAAVTMATLPGARLFHEGQFEGRKVRPPVFLGRRPQETCNQELQSFYATLLEAIDSPVFRDGQWTLCERSGWPDNSSFQSLMAWTWVKDDDRYLVIVNFSDNTVQARVQMPWPDLKGDTWRLSDLLSGSIYDRNGNEMLDPGLYVEVGPWKSNFFQCGRLHPLGNQDIAEPAPVHSKMGTLVAAADI
jgi:hypothetical protein